MRIILFWFYNRITSKCIGNVGLRANLLTIVCNYTLIVNIWQSIDSKLASCFVVCGNRSELNSGKVNDDGLCSMCCAKRELHN